MVAKSEADLLRELVSVYCAITGIRKEVVRDQVDFGAHAENRWNYFTRKKNPLQRLKSGEVESLFRFFRASFDTRFYFYILSNYPEVGESIYGNYADSACDRGDHPNLADVRQRQGQFAREFSALLELGDQEPSQRRFGGQFISFRYETSRRLIASLVTIRPFEPYPKIGEVVSTRRAIDAGLNETLTFRGLFFQSVYGFQMLGLPAPNKGLWIVNTSPVGDTGHQDLCGIMSILSDETYRPLAARVYFARVLGGESDQEKLQALVDAVAEQPEKIDSVLQNVAWPQIADTLHAGAGDIAI